MSQSAPVVSKGQGLLDLASPNLDVKDLGRIPSVFPPEIFFKDIEPNQNYEVTVTIRNITKNMRRIMFTQPSNSRFHCEYENIGSVAAGLSVKMSMQFETTEAGDFHDSIEILTEGYSEPYKLHLHALMPAPDIQFEPMVNFKFIPMGQEKCE